MKQLLTVIFFLLGISSFGQTDELKFKHYTFNEGMSGNYISEIFQDSEGFIWISTDNGIDRFDGYTFVNYLGFIKSQLKINHNITILCINQDASGRLFFGSNIGIIIYDVENRECRLINDDTTGIVHLKNKLVYSVFFDNDGKIWAGTWDGLEKIDLKSNTCIHYDVDTTHIYSYNVVFKIAADKKDNLWIATRYGGIARFNKKNGSVTNFRHKKDDNRSLPVNMTKDIIADSDDDIWIATWGGGLCKYNLKDNSFLVLKKELIIDDNQNDLFINSITQDSKGILWLATENGLKRFNKKTGKFIHSLYSRNKPAGLNNNTLASVYIDRQEGIWVGSVNSGINYYNHYNNKFSTYNLPARVNTICQDQLQNYWYGTSNGIYILDKNQNDVLGNYPDVINQHFKNVSVIYKDKDKNLWIGTGLFIYQYSPSGQFINKISYEAIFNRQGLSGTITDIGSDEKGNLWIGSGEDGLVYYNVKNNQAIVYKKGDSLTISDNRVGIILIDSRNNLWVKVAHQLHFKPYNENKFSSFTTKYPQEKLLSREVNALYEDRSGNIWISTDGGLYKYDYKTGHLYVFKNKVSESINGIIEDDYKNIWLTSAYGLVRFNQKDSSYTKYTVDDGIPDNVFLSNRIYKSTDSSIIFVTGKGLFNVCPELIPENNHVPSLAFTEIWINNQRQSFSDSIASGIVIKSSINAIGTLMLNYKQSDIIIEFSALSFSNPSENRYKYKLIGLQSDWIDLGKSHRINFSNLSPGKYILHIIGANNDGIWNNEGKQLIIVISPPWWNTWWFRTILFLCVAFSVFLFFRIRMASLRQQKVILEKTVEERTREIVSQKKEIEIQADNLKETNLILKEHQEEILQQKEELMLQAEKLSAANQVLNNLNNTKDKLFSIIAHDLKNPFHAISGLSDVLLRDYSNYSIEDQLQNIRMIKDSSDGAATLLENLLQWALIQTNSAGFNPASINIAEIIADCLKIYKVNAKNKGISLVQEGLSDCMVYADRNMAMTIIRNLINNAIKFTPKEGRITINTRKEEEYIIISVTDTGVGMNETTLADLFKINKNKSTSGTEGEKGTGLGLILCKEFAEKNNGSLHVESMTGKGSAFSLWLPFDKNAVFPAPVMKENDKAMPAVKPISIKTENETAEIDYEDQPLILIIDDIIELRRSISQNIKKYFRTIEAVNGKDGIEKALKSIPDLIISDIMMPEMNGYQVCDTLKNDERTSHVPIILLTSKPGNEARIEGYNTGADDYLNKPFPSDVLIARVKNLLESRRKLRERFLKEKYYDANTLADTSHDQTFLQRAFDIVEKNLMNEEFDNDSFIKQMNMSRAQLYRKLRALTNQSVSDFIRTIRLKKAAFLIENTEKRINEIVYQTGFKDPSYFAKAFKNLFGVLPSEYDAKCKK